MTTSSSHIEQEDALEKREIHLDKKFCNRIEEIADKRDTTFTRALSYILSRYEENQRLLKEDQLTR